MTTAQDGDGSFRLAYVIATVIVAALIVAASILVVAPTLRATTTTTERTTLTSTSTGSVTVATSFLFLTASGICTAPGGYAPCWGIEAYVFHCTTQNLLAGPYTPQCAQRVTSTVAPYPSYNTTVTFPSARQGNQPPWANCQWNVAGITPGQGYGYCVLLNSSSFIMGEPAPPHP